MGGTVVMIIITGHLKLPFPMQQPEYRADPCSCGARETLWGVDCAHRNGTGGDEPTTSIVLISLTELGLTGTLPESFGQFKQVTNLRLSDNKLFGQLPHSMVQLTKLSYLTLDGNKFTGIFPPLNFEQMIACEASEGNNFTCPLPPFAKLDCLLQCHKSAC